MKVSVAAKVMSHTVVVAIKSIIGTEPNKLSAEAINTAIFLHDIDILFDSFNGRTVVFRKVLNIGISGTGW